MAAQLVSNCVRTPARARGCQRQEREEPDVSVFPLVLFHGGVPSSVSPLSRHVCRFTVTRQPAALQI